MAEPTSSPEGAGTPRPSENADPVAPADSAGTSTAEGRPNVARAATGPDAPAERTAAVPADPASTSTEPAADRAEAARTPAERPAAAPADARPIFAEPVADRADP